MAESNPRPFRLAIAATKPAASQAANCERTLVPSTRPHGVLPLSNPGPFSSAVAAVLERRVGSIIPRPASLDCCLDSCPSYLADNTSTMAAHPEVFNEKQQVVSLESGSSSPAELVDYLPDPDAGKSDEERARLVRPLHLFFHLLF
jgi:hypothetical protein